jgi:hypothetical protein
LNNAFIVGGDTREIGAVENGVLQRAGPDRGLFSPDLGDNLRRTGGFFVHNGIGIFRGHLSISVERPPTGPLDACLLSAVNWLDLSKQSDQTIR